MKVLVTGAAGCIGSNLAEKLLKRGDEVVGLDNFNDYYDPNIKRRNEQRLRQHPRFKMVEVDVRDRLRLFELCAQEAFTVIAHLAAMAGVRNSMVYPSTYVEVDLNGTQHVMDAAHASGTVRNFVFASTSAVYGSASQVPFVETNACDRPLQPYAAAKRSAEILAYAYHHLFGMNFTALRLFTVYGPHNRPDMMAYLLAESITRGTEIPLYNGGQMYRDWTFVGDITDGMVAALDRPLGYEIINLGRGSPILLKEFVALLEGVAGGRANLVNVSKSPADMECTYADISKARRLLGFNPRISLDVGVRAFWEWYTHAEQSEPAILK